MAKQALGKGLDALIRKKEPTGEPAAKAQPGEVVLKVGLGQVVPSPLQPRGRFNEAELDELVESIRQHGIIQPLIVRAVGEKFELIAGERRWRASQRLGLDTVPVIERVATDQEVLEMALIENLQRQDLDPLEEAAGYLRLAGEFEMKQEDIAKRVGKSRASVANAIRLLDLDPEIQGYVAGRQLSVGHAKALLGIKDLGEQRAAAEHVLKKGFNVRATERFVKNYNNGGGKDGGGGRSTGGGGVTREKSPHFAEVEEQLRRQFATRVNLIQSGKGGRIELEFFSDEELQRILDLLGFEMD